MERGGSARGLAVAAAIVAAAAAYAVADGDAGVSTYRQLRAEVSAAGERAAAQRARVEALRADLHALDSDPLALERVLREDLGLAQPGEVIVRLPPEPVPADSTTP